MTRDPARPLLATGEFGRQAGLTAKALRIYAETGLLRPADVDPVTAAMTPPSSARPGSSPCCAART